MKRMSGVGMPPPFLHLTMEGNYGLQLEIVSNVEHGFRENVSEPHNVLGQM